MGAAADVAGSCVRAYNIHCENSQKRVDEADQWRQTFRSLELCNCLVLLLILDERRLEDAPGRRSKFVAAPRSRRIVHLKPWSSVSRPPIQTNAGTTTFSDVCSSRQGLELAIQRLDHRTQLEPSLTHQQQLVLTP